MIDNIILIMYLGLLALIGIYKTKPLETFYDFAMVSDKMGRNKVFLIATIFSTLGGLGGYLLGSLFLDISTKLLEIYGYENKVLNLKDSLSSGSGLYVWLGTLFLAGFTPLPFKVFTITSGVMSYNLPVFFLICLFTRGLRFFLVAYFTNLFGQKFGNFIEKKGALWFTLTGIFIIILAIVLYIIFT